MSDATGLQPYRYLAPSRLTSSELAFATSGGCDVNPWLAEGFLAAPQVAARALLVVAQVAGTRFWTPPSLVAAAILAADPVVTASPEALRFESFSLCGGVYARFDLPRGALDGEVHRFGTTNVDVNPPLRAALSRVGGRDPLRLRVGEHALAVATLDGQVVEKQVPLSERWVRGFAEVAVAVSGLEPALELRNAGLRRFLTGLPRTPARGASWVVASGSGVRLSTRPGPGAVAAPGVERLRALRDLASFVDSVTVYGRPGAVDAATSVWVAEVDGGRLTLALSPAPSRGFSGEGGLLAALSPELGGGGAGATARLAEAAAGRLGYDVATADWFDRDLPFDRRVLERPGGRLAQAESLVADGAVDLDEGAAAATVRSSGNEYRVRSAGDGWRCTCPWWARHGTDRGPCKHIVAAVLAGGRLSPPG